MKCVRLVIHASGVLVLGATVWAQGTERVSVSSGGVQGNSTSAWSSISGDGRYVAFLSEASNLVANDTNAAWDVFVRDRLTGTTERVSVDSSGAQANGASSPFLHGPKISADGRFVAFLSFATNLVSGDTNGDTDIFLRDRTNGSTVRVSVDSSGVQGNNNSFVPSLSSDGRYVLFGSNASNLVPGDVNGAGDIFVHDRVTGITERVSVDSSGAEASSGADIGSISGDGRYAAFGSSSPDLVPGDTNARYDIFLHDRQTGATERVNVTSGGVQSNETCYPFPSVSFDGRYVAFTSAASDLAPGDRNGTSYDVFVRDRQLGTTEQVSVDSAGNGANDFAYPTTISSDGRRVFFSSIATNLVPGDTNGMADVFVRDLLSDTTSRVSVDAAGLAGNGGSVFPSPSSDGLTVSFHSLATNFVPGDTNGFDDVFVHVDATGFTAVCSPSVGSVQACPCSNSPTGGDRGCNNSSATGGAYLLASGAARLSADTLVFRTDDQRPIALSIVLQGNAEISGGQVYGQGLRCAGGSLKRLFSKSASGGSITAPDFGAGDPSVSAQSAAKGDLIQPGETRWYLVYYRDPAVLGGCPATSTFNATQTGRVDWSF